jgi:hypothetical protein
MRKISSQQGFINGTGTFNPGFSRNFIQFVVNFLIDYVHPLLFVCSDYPEEADERGRTGERVEALSRTRVSAGFG